MTIEGLKQLHAARPFRPFVLHLANGRTLRVKSPERFARSPSGRTAVLYGPRGSFEMIELRQVMTISLLEKAGKGRRSTGGKAR
jgi:hypothetical protein